MPFPSSSVLAAAAVAACALVGLLFLVAAGRRLRRRRYGAGTWHGLSALVFLLVATAIALLGLNLLTYDRLTREQVVVKASFAQAAAQQYNATLVYPSGEIRGYPLSGDEWQIDARVLKWHGIANLLGFDTAYRLERVSGRYSDVDRERTAPHTVYALHAPERIDAWTLMRTWHDYIPGSMRCTAARSTCRWLTAPPMKCRFRRPACWRGRSMPWRGPRSPAGIERGARGSPSQCFDEETSMDQETFNLSIRKFLKMVGVNSQREIEQAVAKAIGDAAIAGTESFPVHVTLEIPRLQVNVKFDGEIKLQ